jgi:uncharacterized membrane protein
MNLDGGTVLELISRWLHILGAITLAGSAIFMRFALHPTLEQSPAEVQSTIKDGVRRRWLKFVHGSIAIVLLTGLFNFYARFAEVKPMPYHAIFGLKFLLAMVVFFIASALVGRSKGLQAMRDRAGFYLNINVVLAVILVALGGLMRYAPLKPTEGAVQSPSALVRPVATSNSASIGTSSDAIANE